MSDNAGTSTSGAKSGIGAGSASVVLIFAVLCLTVFTLIAYIAAGNAKALADAEAELVTGFYNADKVAETVLCEILTSDTLPDEAYGIEINTGYDEELEAGTVYFYIPVYRIPQDGTLYGEVTGLQDYMSGKVLYVNIVLKDNTYDILSWRMTDTDGWIPGGGINVWDGN